MRLYISASGKALGSMLAQEDDNGVERAIYYLSEVLNDAETRGWALDLIGEIRPPSSKNQRYILVDIDYFTKWIEAIPLPNVSQEDVVDFIQKHIIYRFGIPETVTTDQGSVFTGRKMQEFAKEMSFKLLTSMPYYAQANGQVEAANKVIIGLIKKHVGKKPINWHKTLDQRVENSYNKKVKIKTFSLEVLVWKVVLPMDRKDRTLGKWSPKWEDPFQILQVFSNGAYEIEELSKDKRILRVNGKYMKRYRPTL
ncbi:uncharacterized protein LOC127101859 [Lathyrus oleraceus]|uniref:uncharacterized protein LOC127101859 n=1 Tax=Pisum sativum TaxID=3888 RepID=UPI0021CF2E99|nr:uncharacterized protein LOC127101859 [Pisum sativum]